MHYFRSVSDLLGFRAILKMAIIIKEIVCLRYLRVCVFCCQTSYKWRNFFDDYQIIFSTESSSFSCEKTITKISGLVNKLFPQVVINF